LEYGIVDISKMPGENSQRADPKNSKNTKANDIWQNCTHIAN